MNKPTFTVDVTSRIASANGTRIALTAKEYALIELIAINRGAVVTKGAIMAHLYEAGAEPEAKILDVFICKARRKIRLAMGGVDPIATVWGRGYALAA